ncbi:MAG: hypothetical protein LAP85_07735 [Acidobacteriia bacterium]|nr:hypothetical protein [Terriglobia bacterium]
MKLSRRALYLFCFVVAASLLVGAAAQPPAGQVQKKIENTDPAQRLKWYEQHMAMKAQSPFKNLAWRFTGPLDIGGRATSIAVPKGDKKTIYIGTASGGVWKTVNTGVTWTPLFDEMPTLSIGALAIPDTQPNTIWVGTGEANILRGSLAGAGIFKSTDGGKTFQHMGLTDTNTIARIRIHPTNPDIVYVAASGHEWSYNSERGVYKTTDGGKSWRKIFYIDDQTGAIDLIMDPRNPNVLIASMWRRIRQRWSDPVPSGDGLFKTTDGGQNWRKLTNGLPQDWKVIGRIGLDFCLTKPDIVYAYVDNHTPTGPYPAGALDSYRRPMTYPRIMGAEVYRSDDLGETWRKAEPSDPTQKQQYLQNMERFGGTYGWVFSQIKVDPVNPDIIFLMGVGLRRSTDGGKSFQNVSYSGLHSDHHGMWIDPSDTDYIVEVNDGGANASYDGGKTWRDFHAGIQAIQFYNVTLDNATPFNAYGSVQDSGTYRGVGLGPSQGVQGGRGGRGGRGGSSIRWEGAPGGEGTLICVDPTNPNIEYASGYYGHIERSEYVNGRWTSKEIYPKPKPEEPGNPENWGQWLAASMISPHNPSTLYHGYQFVFKTTDKGETWRQISPDLTNFDQAKQGKLPYMIYFAKLTALSESPLKAGVLYAGSDDGRVQVTMDDGAHWTDITAGLPYYKHVWCIAPSKYDPATVYIALIGRHDDDFNPYVYKSTDYGKTWTSIAANLPGGPTNVIREDPKRNDVLYLGTDFGVFVTIDGAKSWSYLGSGLPNAAVWGLEVHPRDNRMVIATDGRGMWILDDVAPIQNAK